MFKNKKSGGWNKEGTGKTIHHLFKLKGYKILTTSQIAFKGTVDGKEGK